MGRPHGHQRRHDAHSLAPCLSNYALVIDEEMREIGEEGPGAYQRTQSYLFILCWIEAMARRINEYCDTQRVVGDDAAEYWLDRFMDYCDTVARMDMVPVR